MRKNRILISGLVFLLVVSLCPVLFAQDGDGGGSDSDDWREGFLVEDETELVPEKSGEESTLPTDPVKLKIELLDQFDVREVMARKREGAEGIVSLQTPGFGRVDPFLIPAAIPEDLRDLVLAEDLDDFARTENELIVARLTQIAGIVPITIRGVIDNGARAYVDFDILGYGRGRCAEGGGTSVGGVVVMAGIVTKDYVQLSIQIPPGGAVSRSFSRGNSDFGGSLGRIRNQGGGQGGRGGRGGRGGGRGGGGGRG
jgi:hypothetical protein